jgi:outer membrane protein TolC
MLERAIQLECRSAIRRLETAGRLVAATLKARDTQKKKLEREVTRFQNGKSDTKTMLDYQNDLELAERDYIQARGALERAKVALQLTTGSLMIRSEP